MKRLVLFLVDSVNVMCPSSLGTCRTTARWLSWLPLLVFLLVIPSGCTATNTNGDNALAARFNRAIQGVETQQTQVQRVMQEATESQQNILFSAQVQFNEKETVAFIEKWEQANVAVNQLRASLDDLNQNYYPMLEQLRFRAQAINDPYIRDQTLSYLDDTQRAYDVQAQEAQRCIDDLDASIRLGNDIVEALKIIGSANFIRIKLEELGKVCKESMEGLKQVNRLVDQGRDLLGLEIEAGTRST
ncbi:MAG: hypothetical protein R2834_23925 [Rhodothermales bacterium]